MMAPASASLLPAAGAKRPFAAPDAAEQVQPLAQESAVTKKNGQSEQLKLECPRCSSSDTKFCYYNNYSTAQPRHYCRTCRRYWTHGRTLRKVPVGGACRRGSGGSKRRRSSAESQTTSSDSPQPDLQETRPLSDHPLPVFPRSSPTTAPSSSRSSTSGSACSRGRHRQPWTTSTTGSRRRGAAVTGRSPPPARGTTSAASSSPGRRRCRLPGTDQRHQLTMSACCRRVRGSCVIIAAPI